MKKSLLITTALVALIGTSNAHAKVIDTLPENGKDGFQGYTFIEDHTGRESAANFNADYLTDDEIIIKNIYMQTLYGDKDNPKGMDIGSAQNSNFANTQKLVVTDGARFDINNGNNFGGIEPPTELAKELLNINDGEVIVQNGEIHSNGIVNISGGKVTLNGGEFVTEEAGAKMLISGGEINIVGGDTVFNGIGVEIDDENPKEGLVEASLGPVEISGGTINVSGKAGGMEFTSKSTGNYLVGSEINISGGELNIKENSGITTVKGYKTVDDAADIAILEKGTINLTDNGTVNLAGNLLADVSGDGSLNFKTAGGTVDGNVSGSKLSFEADHSLSKAISGTIGDLASLNVNQGTLSYDKQAGMIGSLQVKDGAALKVKDDMFVQQDLLLNSGNVDLDGKSLNVMNGGIAITGGTINMNDGSNDPDLVLWAAKDINISGGTVNMNGKNAAIDTFYDWLDENGNLLPKPETPGNINISGGTINVNSDSAEISSEGKIEISDGAVINVNSNAVLGAYKSFIFDPNGVDTKEKATLNVIDGGTINLAGKLLADVSGNGNLNFKTAGGTVDGNVSGSKLSFEADHSLSKAISGTIGDLASLNVNKGTLTYDKQTGKIGDLNVAGGLDIGTNTVNATNVDFADKSNLALRVASTDSFGNINADSIKIGTDTTMKVTLDNGVVANGKDATFKFLNGGKVEGSFTNKIAENSRYDIAWNDDGSLKITGTATASDVVADAGGSANNAQTAEAWDSVTSSANASAGAKAVASILGDLSQNATTAAGQKAYVDALTAVAPEVAPAVQQTSTETANQVFGAVGTRLTGGSVSTGGEGMSSGDSIFKRGAMWVQGMFNKSKLDDTSKSKGFDADSNGIAFGAEKYINDDVKAGIGYAYAKTDIDGFMRSTDVDTHTAIVYGEYKPSNWYVNGIATYGWSDYSEDKNVAGVGVKADYDVETFGLQAMTGYDMQVKGFDFTPEAGLRYVHIKQDSYKDSADQRVSGNDSDILTGVIGAKVSKNFELSNGMNIKPEARIAATYDLMNDDVNSVVTLANGSAYSVDGEALDRFGMEFGAGVTAEVNDNVELSLGYEGKFREDYTDHTGLLNAKYKF